MSMNRTPPKPVAARQRLLPQLGIERSLSEPKLCEHKEEDNVELNVTQRTKRRREDDLLADLCSFKDEMKNMLQSFMNAQQKEREIITANLKEIQQSSQDINNAIALLTSQNEDFRKKIEQLEGQRKKDTEYISLLEEKIEDLQRENRKANIEIKNVPKKINESKDDLIDMVLSLAKTVSCKMDRADIKDIYRVKPKKTEKKTPIIVEMGSTLLKADLLKMCKSYNIRNNKNKLQAKHMGHTTDEHEPVFVSEQLTAKAARLYFLARDLTRSKRYKFCWTSFGRVYVRLNETSPITQIKNEAQVHHLLQSASDM